MTRIILSAAVLVFFSGQVAAQDPASPAPPESLTAGVDKIFEQWDKPHSPGCVLAMILDGRIIYKRAYGMANLDHDVPLTPSSLFHVASMSKQFTAAAIVLLAQEGKLSLDDDVRKYIPELPDYGAAITLRHLVHHTSGIRDQWGLLGLAGWRYSHDWITNNDVLEMTLRQQALNFRPGDKYEYSNTNYTLLALVVERVTGQTLRQLTTSRILEPLGMKNTHFRDDFSEVVKNMAYSYERAGDGSWRLSITNFDTVGATSLLTTVEDLAQWDQNFYEPRVGGKAMIEQLHERGRLNNGAVLDDSFGFGSYVQTYRGLPVMETGGGDAAYRAYLGRFPRQRFAVACLCNAGPAWARELGRRVADLYLAAEFKEPAQQTGLPAVQLSQQELAAKTGIYWNRDADDLRLVSLQEGKLHVATVGGRSFEIEPLGQNHFRVVLFPFVHYRFEPASLNGPLRLVRTQGNDPSTTLEPLTPFASSINHIKEYGGTYVCEEIDALYQLTVENDQLVLKRLKFEPAVVEPVLPDIFVGPPGTLRVLLRFLRDSQKRVSTLTLEPAASKVSAAQSCRNESAELEPTFPRLGRVCCLLAAAAPFHYHRGAPMPRRSSQRPYTLLARFYDQLTREAPRMNRHAREKVLGRILPHLRTVCDLGCGTGTAAIELARGGLRVYALDLSPEMVRLARRKVGRLPARLRARIRIRRADMRRFRLPEPVDLVLSQFNPVNHLPRKSDLGRAFGSVARALRPGGWFCFDLNTRRTYEKLYPMTRWEERPGFCLVTHGGFDPRRHRAWLDLEWFVAQGASWRRTRERIRDTFWSDAEIRRALRRAGFERIRLWDGVDVRPHQPQARRGYDAYFLAQKPHQGRRR